MKGIPKFFQTKQDVLNTHRLAMTNKIDKKEWKNLLIQLTQPTRYVLPIFKVESNCFYIPYTDLPLPSEYSQHKLVYGFEPDVPMTNIVIPEKQEKPEIIDMEFKNDAYTMNSGPEYNPNYQPPQTTSNNALMMLKIYASIDSSMNQLIIYHGCPFYEMTDITPEEVNILLKELV